MDILLASSSSHTKAQKSGLYSKQSIFFLFFKAGNKGLGICFFVCLVGFVDLFIYFFFFFSVNYFLGTSSNCL